MSRRSGPVLRVAATLAALAASACAPSPPAPAPPAPTVTPTASPTPSPDYTQPGAAAAAIDELMVAARSSAVLMVSLKQAEATVSVLRDGKAETWSFRQGRPQQVETDLAYVDQSTFDVDDWNVSDLGALFRAAAAVSGSTSGQELHIVDASAGEIRMSVSTVPESRPIFFNPDGTLMPTLDLTSGWGLAAAYKEVANYRTRAVEVGFSNQAAYADFPGDETGTTVRHTRGSWLPLTIATRPGATTSARISLSEDLPTAVWKVLSRAHEEGEFRLNEPWTCTARSRDTGVRLDFTIGTRSFTTDLSGKRITA